MNEKEQLLAEIRDAEAALKPKQERLRELLNQDADAVELRVKMAKQLQATFTLDELTFAATSRCACGAGLAYPKNIGMHGSWTCSDILLGRAKPKSDPEHKVHDGDYPFAFYEIKSENQPSAGGATTRPKE